MINKAYLPIKRLLDVICSLITILLLSWLYIIIALLVIFTSKGGPIFKQPRLGKNKKVFNIYKFRTMRVDAPHDIPTTDFVNLGQYFTPVGKFLRTTGLDELPQLFNILIGNMSFIGPRPSLVDEQPLVKERENNNVYLVKPGLSGLAQIKERNKLSVYDKALLDGEYVKNFSFSLDVQIFFKTIIVIFKK